MLLRDCFQKKQRYVDKALRCQGWTNEKQLSLLFELSRKTEHLDGDILEIGSAWGRSTVLFGIATKKRIYSIDPHTGGRAFIEKDETQNSFPAFLKNIEKYGLSDRVITLTNTTQEVIERKLMPKTQRFSLVFIDGLHTPSGVKIDFNFAYEYLSHSGVMLFHDYFEPTVQDYAQMIDELTKRKGVDLIKDQHKRLVWLFKDKLQCA